MTLILQVTESYPKAGLTAITTIHIGKGTEHIFIYGWSLTGLQF
jgi:hypothetical protein